MSEKQEAGCIVCGQVSPLGIALRGRLICAACEQEIMHASVGSPRYDMLLARLRQVWENAPD